jgi:tripartite-type tricarboxylate transporter receptor subunit TctC
MTARRALLAGLLAAPLAARAQPEWTPTRPIRLVVGFPPGGSGDFLCRTLMEPFGRELGVTIIVDNRPGAGSNIATEHVAHSEGDGHTLLVGGNFSHAVNPALYRRVPFDPIADFTAISKLTDLPTIIAVAPSSGITSLRQLVERIRAEPGRWNYSTPGNGTPSHLAGARLSKVADLQLTHIPFRGGAPSVQAVLAGDVQIIIGTPPVVLPQVRAGRLTALSLTTAAASAVIPGIPGATEAGLPGLDIGGWWGLWAPKGLAAPVRDRLFAATKATLASPGIAPKLAGEGLQATPSASPAEFDAYIRSEIPFWADVVKSAGAVLE